MYMHHHIYVSLMLGNPTDKKLLACLAVRTTFFILLSRSLRIFSEIFELTYWTIFSDDDFLPSLPFRKIAIR
jgi:hypothetical protein